MNYYAIQFKGRKRNAVGVYSNFTVVVRGVSPQEARLQLYGEYQDISIELIHQLQNSEGIQI